eukprot:Platyproteum_vivax@DN14711_c0_g1_i1.p1
MPVCQFWLNGTCKFGAHCKNLHSKGPSPKIDDLHHCLELCWQGLTTFEEVHWQFYNVPKSNWIELQGQLVHQGNAVKEQTKQTAQATKGSSGFGAGAGTASTSSFGQKGVSFGASTFGATPISPSPFANLGGFGNPSPVSPSPVSLSPASIPSAFGKSSFGMNAQANSSS